MFYLLYPNIPSFLLSLFIMKALLIVTIFSFAFAYMLLQFNKGTDNRIATKPYNFFQKTKEQSNKWVITDSAQEHHNHKFNLEDSAQKEIPN